LAGGEEPLDVAALLAPAAEEGTWPGTDEPLTAASFVVASSAALLSVATSAPAASTATATGEAVQRLLDPPAGNRDRSRACRGSSSLDDTSSSSWTARADTPLPLLRARAELGPPEPPGPLPPRAATGGATPAASDGGPRDRHATREVAPLHHGDVNVV
jgi:hypothetical protein